MKILLLSRYGRLGSSSRLRFYQYLDYLHDHGLQITTSSLFDDAYVTNLYAGRRKSLATVALAYGRRLARLLTIRHFDLIWLEGELFPYLPAWAERWLAHVKVPLVVDYDDAIFHRYDEHPNPLVQSCLGGKIDAVMRHADMVIAGSDYLVRHAIEAGAKRVEFLPTVIDLSRYPLSPHNNHGTLTIGWMGSPVTAKYLLLVKSALAEVCAAHDASLVLIGAGDIDLSPVPYESRPWTEETESTAIASFDLGIMPLADTPWERGKCGYKLIQYMAGCKPVVASPVGANTRIVEEGINGFLAADQREWLDACNTLVTDHALRERMGRSGREKVEREYCLQVTAPVLKSLLLSL
ncbi:MAG: glycosyltransferase family 4 protein [Thermoleophilia bacterium]